jgi:exodeoxyribonuclease-3
MIKIATRNINGIRAVAEKGFANRILAEDIDILCIQEPKAFEHQNPPSLAHLYTDYEHIRHHSTIP